VLTNVKLFKFLPRGHLLEGDLVFHPIGIACGEAEHGGGNASLVQMPHMLKHHLHPSAKIGAIKAIDQALF
jgi:hypothetical protein